jgi:hypothetical protein
LAILCIHQCKFVWKTKRILNTLRWTFNFIDTRTLCMHFIIITGSEA